MLSLGQLQPNRYYHIFVAADNARPLFVHRDDHHAFLQAYQQHIVPVMDTYAYCLLPTHLHLLIRPRTLPEQVDHWYEHGEVAPFEPVVAAAQWSHLPLADVPLQAAAITTLLDAHHLLRYIHRNPTHHHIADFRTYTWSSYNVMLKKRPTFVNRAAVIGWHYNNPEWYEEAHWEAADLARIGYLIAKD